MRHVTIPAGEVKYLTVDVKALQENQRLCRENFGKDTGNDIPVCWIQVGGDKQNKINCWHIEIFGRSEMVYGHPRLCGAMVYIKTSAELEYTI